MTNSTTREQLIGLLKDEKTENTEELRYYTSFLFKYMPIIGSILLASFGYALNKEGRLIFAAIPLLVNIFAVVFIYIDYNLVLLDGYVRVLENVLNKTVGTAIYRKSSELTASVYGGESVRIPVPYFVSAGILALIIVAIYVASTVYAVDVMGSSSIALFRWPFCVFCVSAPVALLMCYFVMHRRITKTLGHFKRSYEVEIRLALATEKVGPKKDRKGQKAASADADKPRS